MVGERERERGEKKERERERERAKEWRLQERRRKNRRGRGGAAKKKRKEKKKKKKNRVNKNYTVRYGTIRQMFVGGKRSRIGKGSLFIHQYEISYRALLLELIMLMSRDLLCSVEY